jgi:acyl carrier protein
MTRDEIRQVVLDALGEIAPEANPATLDPRRPFRDQLDLDSVDYLNFLVALDRSLHVPVPESDYARVAGLDALVDYLAARVGTGGPPDNPTEGRKV